MSAEVLFPDGTRIEAEVADIDEARARGLMFRPALADSEGMLFTFDTPHRWGFWMKNVRMALDILWLDARGRIVWMVEDAPPCHTDPCPMYVSKAKASFVLEVRGGFARRHRVAVGDTVTINRRSSSSSSRTATPGRC